jgi:hypothetical protein
MADWLAPVPVRLMVTVAPRHPFGPGTYRWLAEQLSEEIAHRAGLLHGQVGVVGFTQPNSRGGLHSHNLAAGPEVIGAVHRVTLARDLEARWGVLQPMNLDHDFDDQAVRVDITPVRTKTDIIAYCVRYAGRHTSGDMFEAGRGLDGWGLVAHQDATR